MGSRRPADITLSVADILEPRGITFIHETVNEVQPDELKVCTDTDEYAYDLFDGHGQNGCTHGRKSGAAATAKIIF